MPSTQSQLWLSLAALVLASLLYYVTSLLSNDAAARFRQSRPVVGIEGQQWLAWPRALLRTITESPSMVTSGYEKFSKRQLPFVLPSLTSNLNFVVMLPACLIKDVLNRPEPEVDSFHTQNETIQARYLVGDEDIWVNNFQVNVIRKQLTRNIPNFSETMAQELAMAFEEIWGSSKEGWTSVKAWDSVLDIIARAANRIFVGLPLCRDAKFPEYSRKYSMTMFGGGGFINLFPAFTRPVVGQIVGLVSRFYLRKCNKVCRPFVEDRLQHTLRKDADPSYAWTAPVGGLQWIIEECQKTGDPKQLVADKIIQRLLLLNMVSVHSTSFTTTNTILDLFSSSPQDGFVPGLRTEADAVLAESDGHWTKEAVAHLYRADSCIRESMRFSSFGTVALPRRVQAKKGIDLPVDNGKTSLHIPCGVRLAVPMNAIHRDAQYYSNPDRFDAFRFSRPREEHDTIKERPTQHDTDQTDEEKAAMISKPSYQAVVNGSETFLGFGMGAHSCPGRYFASHEMKLMLAMMVQMYDVKFMAKRPVNAVVVDLTLPSSDAVIRVRRRK